MRKYSVGICWQHGGKRTTIEMNDLPLPNINADIIECRSTYAGNAILWRQHGDPISVGITIKPATASRIPGAVHAPDADLLVGHGLHQFGDFPVLHADQIPTLTALHVGIAYGDVYRPAPSPDVPVPGWRFQPHLRMLLTIPMDDRPVVPDEIDIVCPITPDLIRTASAADRREIKNPPRHAIPME